MLAHPIRTVIVDDHPVVLTGVRTIIEAEDDISCVGTANSGSEALEIVAATAPDVVVVDVSLPDVNGLVLAEQIIRGQQAMHVVIMTLYNDPSYVKRAIEVGAKGFVQKCSAVENLVLAIRSVVLGGMFFDPPTAMNMTARDRGHVALERSVGALGLTKREQDVLSMVAHGYSNKEIAARANISIKSIETYKARATEKLNLHSRAQIVQFAMAQGWMNGTWSTPAD